MRRGITVAVAVVLSAAAVGLGAGCGGSDPSAASTPADATTIANNAPQTDSSGKTVPAPGASSGAASAVDTADGAASGAASGGAAVSGGDAAAGKTVFLASCQGCHPSAGTVAGVGPAMSTTKMDEAQLKTQVEKGTPGMPGGLASGADLDNVVAYVLSIKQ